MTKQKQNKAVDAASKAEDLLPLEQMMVQGGAPNEGAAYAVDDANQDKDSEHHGTESKGASLVPKLRFAGFTEPWTTCKLGELGQAISGIAFPENAQGGVEGIPFFKVSDMNLEGNETVMRYANNYVSHEFIIKSKWNPIEWPAIFFAKVGAAVFLNRKRLVLSLFLCDNNTMAYVLDVCKWDSYFALVTFESLDLTELVQFGALPSYGVREIYALEIAVPSLAEQQRIGEFFKALDQRIAQQRAKLEKLGQLKKALLEQMFPREGESVPRLRFAGVTEPWTVCKLGDLGQAISGIAFPESAQGGVEGMPFFKVSDMNLEGNESVMHYANNYVSYELVAKSKWKPIEGPAVIFVRDGAAVLLNRKRLILSKCLMDHHIMHYCLDESVWNPFFALAIFEGIDLTALVRTSVTPSYGAAEVEAIVVKVPNLAEQQRIGAFFKALDQRIAQQRAKLEKLGQLKKALLEQMFV